MQVLVFKRIAFANTSIFIYPIFIMLLPAEIPSALAIGISFVFGISLDFFYDSPGIHAGTCVFTAFLRYYLLGFMEPKGGYPLNSAPTKSKLGVPWFLRYSAIFMLVHLFIYFSIEAFSFVHIATILVKTCFSFVLSMIFVSIYQFLLDPKE
jgi:hypothetical protein